GSVVTKASKGASVTVYSTTNGWSKVTVSGKTGYVESKYLSTTKPVVTTTKYATTRISIRSTASTKGSVVTKASKGASVTVYSTTNGWSKVP
ncbi:SH3 domain-containing protein, partial [Heyndrickxia ginsengihumi]|uniref:SH3 domain-containing protein n=1 Tax=Heyndrickxia ginsengihumi TaxID=363870 RepID=UPI00203C5B31